MKPKTKKILIIAAAVVAIAVIVWLMTRSRNKSTSAIISRLNVDSGVKGMLTSMVDYINTSWDEAHRQRIVDTASAKGITVAQQTVVEAAYALLDSNKIDQATYSSIIAQI